MLPVFNSQASQLSPLAVSHSGRELKSSWSQDRNRILCLMARKRLSNIGFVFRMPLAMGQGNAAEHQYAANRLSQAQRLT